MKLFFIFVISWVYSCQTHAHRSIFLRSLTNLTHQRNKRNSARTEPSLPVKLVHFCKDLSIFKNIKESSKVTATGNAVTIYYMDERNPNTLHFVLTTPPGVSQHEYILAMMMDDRGVPSGHFHLFPCGLSHPPEKSGVLNLGIRCTNAKKSKTWGNTQLAYSHSAKLWKPKQSFFWSWIPEDGPRPKLLQLRFAYIKGQTIWIGLHSPVIEFKTLWLFEPPKVEDDNDDDDDQDGLTNEGEYNCYQNQVSLNSAGNFVISNDQTFIETNSGFLAETNQWFDKNKVEALQDQVTKYHFSSTTVLPDKAKEAIAAAPGEPETITEPSNSASLNSRIEPPLTSKPATTLPPTPYHFSSTTVLPDVERVTFNVNIPIASPDMVPPIVTATTTTVITTIPTTTTTAMVTRYHLSSTTVLPGAKRKRRR